MVLCECGVDPVDWYWYQVSFTARKSDRHKVVEDGSMHGGVINNLSFDSGLHVSQGDY